MKVKAFLNKMMMSSDVDCVRVEKDGYTKAEYDEIDLFSEDYGVWGEEAVKTFQIDVTAHGVELVINV